MAADADSEGRFTKSGIYSSERRKRKILDQKTRDAAHRRTVPSVRAGNSKIFGYLIVLEFGTFGLIDGHPQRSAAPASAKFVPRHTNFDLQTIEQPGAISRAGSKQRPLLIEQDA